MGIAGLPAGGSRIMYVVFLNISKVQEIPNYEIADLTEITKTPFFQYLRRVCPLHESEAISLAELQTKLRHRFELSPSELKAKLRPFIDRNILLIGYEDQVSINLLANKNRRQIYNRIRTYPGLYAYRIQQLFELGTNQTLWHLGFLVEFEYIREFAAGKVKIYAEFHCNLRTALVGYVLLKDSLRQLLEVFLYAEEPLTVALLQEQVEFNRAKIYYILKKLQKLGIMEKSMLKRGAYRIDTAIRPVVDTLQNHLDLVVFSSNN